MVSGADLPEWHGMASEEKAVPPHLPHQNYHRIQCKCKQCFVLLFSSGNGSIAENNEKINKRQLRKMVARSAPSVVGFINK